MKQKPTNKSKMYKAVIGMVVLLLLAWGAFWMFRKDSEPLLSRDQATMAVLSEYPGKVDNLKLQAGAYVAELQTEQGRYELKLDGVTGEILSIVLLKRTDEPAVLPTPAATPAPSGGAAVTPSPVPSPAAQSVSPKQRLSGWLCLRYRGSWMMWIRESMRRALIIWWRFILQTDGRP